MLINKIIIAIVGASLAAPAIASSGPAAGAKQIKYCVKSITETGTHIRVTECRTKAQWAQRGVDVDQLGRK
jgi:hypothetical protein